MNAKHSSRGQTIPAVAVALGAIAVVAVAFVVLVWRPVAAPAGGGARPSAPVATPAATPAATPKPISSATPAPSAPAPASPSTDPYGNPVITLNSPTGHRVQANVIDQTDSLVNAVSGKPGDGMSVRWHDSIVRQRGANAVEITWVALPQDDSIGVGVHHLDGPLAIVIVQEGPAPNSDAIGEDLVVVLTFDHPVDADEINVEVLDRTID